MNNINTADMFGYYVYFPYEPYDVNMFLVAARVSSAGAK